LRIQIVKFCSKFWAIIRAINFATNLMIIGKYPTAKLSRWMDNATSITVKLDKVRFGVFERI